MSHTIACPSCGSQRDDGTGPCPACGAVAGGDNVCPSCKATASVREIAPGAYACMACGAPRTRLAGTHVASDFGAALMAKANTARLLSRVGYGVAALFALSGVALAAVLRALSWGSSAMVLALLSGAAALGAYVFASGRAKEAREVGRKALERRLLSLAAGPRAGVTVSDAARATARVEDEVDDALTALAARGRLDMDVDDDGVIRYRIASDAREAVAEFEEASAAEPASRSLK